MANIKKVNILLLIALLFITACSKKDGTTVEPIAQQCKIISIKEGDDPATTYAYDSNGEISKVSNLYGFGTGTFTYQTGKVDFTNITGSKNQSFSTDALGRITSDENDTYKYNAMDT